MRESMVMLPFEVSKDFTDYYERLFVRLANETVEKVKDGYKQKQYMNKKEAAQYIGVSFNTFQKLEKMGLPIIEVDGLKLVNKKDIDCFLDSYKQIN